MKTTGIYERAGKMPALSHFLPIFLALLLIASIYLFSPNYRLGEQTLASPFAGDYLHEWIGGWIIAKGDTEQLYRLPYALALQHDPQLVGFAYDETRYLPMVYPPYYYMLVSPLSQLPFLQAVWVWNALLIAAFFAAMALLLCQFPNQPSANWLIPAACCFAPLIESLNSGQKGTILLWLFAGTYYLLTRQRSFAAGLLFGLLAMKPQLAVVIGLAMLAKRDAWFVAGSTCSVGICLLSGLSLGTDISLQYLEFSRQAADYIQTGGYTLHKSHSWYGCFALLFGSGTIARGATLAATLATVVVLCFSLRGKIAYDSPRFALQFAGLTFASLLISPHLYTYDLAILLLPLALFLSPAVKDYLTDRQLSQLNVPLAAGIFILAGCATTIALQTQLALMPLAMFAALIWTCYALRTHTAVITASFPSPQPDEIATA